MKKTICVILATLMLFALVGCGGSTTSPKLDLSKSKYLGENNTNPLPEGINTATFIINNIDVSHKKGADAKISIGLYSKDLNKELFVNEERLSDFSSFYCRYTEGDYVKIIWIEDEKGNVIKSSLIFEDVGEG